MRVRSAIEFIHLYFEIPLTNKQTIYFRETLQEVFDYRACLKRSCRSLYNNIIYLQTAGVGNECKHRDKSYLLKTSTINTTYHSNHTNVTHS